MAVTIWGLGWPVPLWELGGDGLPAVVLALTGGRTEVALPMHVAEPPPFPEGDLTYTCYAELNTVPLSQSQN